MSARTLAVVHDPRRRLSAAEVRARIGRALDGEGARYENGALYAGWTPAGPGGRPPVIAVDGAVAPPLPSETAAWQAALRATRGAFAVIAWDGRHGLMARDRLGARPLFYAMQGGVLYAASEVPTLLRLLPRRPAPDRDALALWLAGRPGPAGATLFEGVRPLPPGHALVLDGGTWRVERYWGPSPRRGLEGASAGEAAALVHSGVREAVRVTGGDAVLLSGGLDSSAVMASAAENAQAAAAPPPTAFSVVFPDRPDLDESVPAGAVAERWGAPLRRVPAARGPVAPHLWEYLERFALPVENPNGAFFRPALSAAAEVGAEVLLDGEGGDELFGCEPLLLADRLRAGDPRGAWRLARTLPGTGGRLHRRSANVILRKWVAPGIVPPRGLTALRRLQRARGSAPSWLLPAFRDRVAAESDGAWWRPGAPRWRSHLAWVLTDGRAEMGVQDRLRREAALAGVVDAHPLLDLDLAELVLGLPPELSFDPELDRPLLRLAMRGLLPERVRLRPDKVYFTALLLEALTGPDRATVETTLGQGALELGMVADAAAVRRLWASGPEHHPHGRWSWSIEVWRAFAAETWLRGESG